MASVAVELQQSVVMRVANLPLVSSTCDMVSSAYISTKENHPYLKSVCEVAEKGVKTITAVAFSSTKPIIQKLEPQIALANNYACIGLDRIEERLPILYQPTDKLVANATDMVAGAKEAVAGTVTGAKDTVAHTITGVVDKTKGAVQESMEMTKAVVTGSINAVLGSRMVQVVSTGVDAALTKSEVLVDQYLPLSDDELAKEATRVEGFEADVQKPSYYIRLGSLSSKVHKRAYEQALTRVKDAKCRSQEAISKLHHTIDLLDYAHKNMSSANQKLHDAQERLYQSWVDWKRSTGQQDGEEAPSTEHIESRTLTMAENWTRQLQTTCLTLVSSIQGLPQHIQDKAHHIHTMAGNVYQNVRSAASFRDVSDQLLTTSKGQLKKMRESLDDVMDYLVNNTPLNWLLSALYRHLTSQSPTCLQNRMRSKTWRIWMKSTSKTFLKLMAL
ncbi:perilipin-2-like isoform X2 [Rhinatrema bivittatum]|uniref:perilipin-2-like isoform X2 n=1 Tax=Rhinatrema bivittatum TaxID=194408 RepID=UPI001125FE68|nr:perilipin-2-like isoform X2 [Rhinatrema bivittatum]